MPDPSIDRNTLDEWDAEHVWHPFTQMQEYAQQPGLFIERGEGCWLIDRDGNRLLDGVSSLWCNVHGHAHPHLNAAIRRQLDRIAHSTIIGATHEPGVILARRLVELAAPLSAADPESQPLRRVFYSDNGATAVEVALKMAFQYWRQRPDPRLEKTRYVCLGNSYHGDTIGSVSVGGVELFHSMFGPLLFETFRAPSPHCYRCPLGLVRESCQIDCLAELSRILAEHHRQIAAVVVEPLVQGAAGMVTAPEGFLRGVRDATRRHDVLLIADEVAVGFGRTGTMFACEQERVSPDFLCLAKGLTGGYLPLAATLTTDEVYSAFLGTAADKKTFFHGHTYSGNPLGAAVALASLELFESEGVLERVAQRAGQLRAGLQSIATLPHVGSVRQRGLIAGIELVRDRASKAPFDYSQQLGARVCRAAREFGVLIRPLGNVIVLMPPLSINQEELGILLDATRRAIAEVTESVAARLD